MDNKILINGSIIHEKPTGLGVYAINIIKEMDKKSEVEVYSPIALEEVQVKRISKYVKPSYKKIGAIARILWTQLLLPFKGNNEDIIYHPFQYLSLFSRKKQIITIHDFIPVYYPVAKHQKFYYKNIMPILLKKAEKIICISENTKKDLQSLYDIDQEKIKVVYNGYDSLLFNKNINKETIKKYNIKNNYLVMVGASYSHKNLEIVIEAFKNIKKDNLELVIVGGNSTYLIKLKKIVEELNLKDKVKFLGYVPDEELRDIYGNSLAFIYPTLYEGFGLPILEAQACGTAVICSNSSSLPEVYGDSAISFNPKDKKDIEKSILRLIEEKGLRDELLKKGEENIKRFSWEKTAEEIIKLMKK